MLHRRLIQIALLALAGLPAQAGAAKPIQGRPLDAVHEDPEPFLLQSPGRTYYDTAAGVIGPIEMFYGVFMTRAAQQEGGRKMMERFKLADPAPAIAAALAREICPLVGCSNVVRQTTDRSLTLSVRTSDWALTHLPTNWKRYRIRYKVDARLLDPVADRVVADGSFVYNEKFDDAGRAPQLEDLLGNDAALLKSKFRELEPLAVTELKGDFEKDLRRKGLSRHPGTA